LDEIQTWPASAVRHLTCRPSNPAARCSIAGDHSAEIGDGFAAFSLHAPPAFHDGQTAFLSRCPSWWGGSLLFLRILGVRHRRRNLGSSVTRWSTRGISPLWACYPQGRGCCWGCQDGQLSTYREQGIYPLTFITSVMSPLDKTPAIGF
jgi:hypothetical protein